MMRGAGLGVLLLLVASSGSVGCQTFVAKRAISEVRGADADLHLIADVAPGAFAAYQSFSFEPATTSVGPRICPPELLRAYDDKARKLQTNGDLARHYPGGPPELRIRTDFLYSQKRGIFSAAQAIARVTMSAEGRAVADAIVRAESESFLRGGNSALAEACVDEIEKFLKSRKGASRERSRGRASD